MQINVTQIREEGLWRSSISIDGELYSCEDESPEGVMNKMEHLLNVNKINSRLYIFSEPIYLPKINPNNGHIGPADIARIWNKLIEIEKRLKILEDETEI